MFFTKARIGSTLAVALIVVPFGSALHCGGNTSSGSPTSDDAGAGVSGDENTQGQNDAAEEAGQPGDGSSVSSCPNTGDTSKAGKVQAADVSETSGIINSSLNQDTYWIHNDSGDSARAFAISKDGTLRATLSFDTKKPTDIEDIAVEDASAHSSFLYLADIGDNNRVRKEITIHRVAEPKLTGPDDAKLAATSETMQVIYADGAHNAETLFFDPIAKELLIATKQSGTSDIHRIGKFVAGSKATTEKIATVSVDTATGGDISRNGRFVAIRNYSSSGFVWVRSDGESLADALAREPCKVPVMYELQGEAFGFLHDNSGYVTIAEGDSPELHVVLFK